MEWFRLYVLNHLVIQDVYILYISIIRNGKYFCIYIYYKIVYFVSRCSKGEKFIVIKMTKINTGSFL
jgi:hypothetical protein